MESVVAHIEGEAIQAEKNLKKVQSHLRCMEQYYELRREVGTLLRCHF